MEFEGVLQQYYAGNSVCCVRVFSGYQCVIFLSFCFLNRGSVQCTLPTSMEIQGLGLLVFYTISMFFLFGNLGNHSY